MADWNSALYMKFENERTRAARDLLAQIPEFEADRIFDLGCGAGNGTQLLTTAFSRATIVGLDLSDNMLVVARARVATARFIKQNIETWQPNDKVDLIFANAALHFVPNHHALMMRLVSFLQMPNNIQELSHALMRMVATEWALGKQARPYRQDAHRDRCARFILLIRP
jgi:trans-aconitate 2-methyltransferase